MTVRVLHDPLATTPSASPLSPGLASGPFIFLSGQIGRDPVTQQLPTTIEEQTEQALQNMRRVLADGGADLSHVMTMTIFLARPEDKPGMNAVYRTFFSEPFPARAAVVVAALGSPETLVEMQAVAYVGP